MSSLEEEVNRLAADRNAEVVCYLLSAPVQMDVSEETWRRVQKRKFHLDRLRRKVVEQNDDARSPFIATDGEGWE